MNHSEARRTGAKRYNGRPCAKGHGTERYTSTRSCVHCARDKTNEWYGRRGSALAKHRHRKNKYGLDEAQFASLLALQEGKCAICSVVLIEGDIGADGLAIDHNHATGEVRGLLCNNCNRAIGMLKDSPERADAAAAYLRRTQ